MPTHAKPTLPPYLCGAACWRKQRSLVAKQKRQFVFVKICQHPPSAPPEDWAWVDDIETDPRQKSGFYHQWTSPVRIEAGPYDGGVYEVLGVSEDGSVVIRYRGRAERFFDRWKQHCNGAGSMDLYRIIKGGGTLWFYPLHFEGETERWFIHSGGDLINAQCVTTPLEGCRYCEEDYHTEETAYFRPKTAYKRDVISVR